VKWSLANVLTALPLLVGVVLLANPQQAFTQSYSSQSERDCHQLFL